MIESVHFANRRRSEVKAAALAACLGLLAACASTGNVASPQPAEVAAAAPSEPSEPEPPAAPPPPPPPPVDLTGKWKLALGGGGACVMTLAVTSGAVEGSVAPAGGCPGNFFMSRKWTFEHDKLVIRDHKGEVLSELSFAGGRFEGKSGNGAAVTLAR